MISLFFIAAFSLPGVCEDPEATALSFPALPSPDSSFPDRPQRAEPHPNDLDARGYADKVTFYQGQPVIIVATGDSPEIQPLDISANGILVSPTYLSYLEKVEVWGRGLEDYHRVNQAACMDRQDRLEWQVGKLQEKKPFFKRDGVLLAEGALVATVAILTAAWSLNQVQGGE
jgi:hypothetical protein